MTLALRMRDFCAMTFVVSAAWGSNGHAAGLGAIAVQSGLGQPLRVSIALLGADAFDDGYQCVKAKVSSLEGGMPIAATASVARNAQSAAVEVTTHRNVNELAVNISVSIGCTATVHRDYQVLLDPVVALPAVQAPLPPKSARPSTSDARFLTQAAAQPDGNTFATGPAKRQLVGTHAENHQPRPNSDTLAAATPLKKADRISRPKTRKIWRNVFTLSSADQETGTREIDRQAATLALKMATTISPPAIETDPQKLADTRARQTRLAALLRDEDPEKTFELRMKSVQDEVQALRAESGRRKQQDEANQAVLQATGIELRRWVGGLGAVLLVCFGAIGWLLMRLYIDKKNDVHAPWDRIIEDYDTDSGDLAHGGDTIEPDHLATMEDSDWPTDPNWHEPDLPVIAAEPVGASSVAHPPGDTSAPESSQNTAAGFIPCMLAHGKEPDYPKDTSEKILNAEEVSDITELAEVWMAIHRDPMKLLELLEPFRDVEKPESCLPWLCLADVYRAIGDGRKYDAMLQRITKTFNVKMVPWDAEPVTGPSQTLADLPHIREKILDLWDSPEIVPYLQGLLNDQRDGTRDGFDLPVYRSLMQLLKLARAPERSKRHDQKAYAILFGVNVAREATAKSDSGPASSKPAAETAHGANTVQAETSGDPELAGIHPSVARRDTAVHEWLAEESTCHKQCIPLDPPASSMIAAPSKSPVRKQPKNAHVAHPEAAVSRQAANNNSTPISVDIYPKRTTAEVPALLESSNDAVKCEAMSAMTIRLHLAISYQDIGDEEGALLLLDEVIKEGTSEQCAHAKSIRAQLVPPGNETERATAKAGR